MNIKSHVILGEKEILNYLDEENQSWLDDLNKAGTLKILDCTYGKGLHYNMLKKRYPNANILALDFDKNIKQNSTDNIKYYNFREI